MFHKKTKYIDYKIHFVIDKVEDRKIEVMKIHTSINSADIFTKLSDFEKFRSALNLVSEKRFTC